MTKFWIEGLNSEHMYYFEFEVEAQDIAQAIARALVAMNYTGLKGSIYSVCELED